MKLYRNIVPITLIILFFGLSFGIYKVKSNKDQLILEILMDGLNSSHYSPKKIDDNFSASVFKLYLEKLDFNKKFLLKKDVEQLEKYKNKIDDEIKSGSFDLLKVSNELIRKRILEKESWYKEILSSPLDYKSDEKYETDAEKISFASGEKELKTEWKKALLYQTNIRIDEMLDQQEKAKERKDTIVKILP
ncbi:MAG: tail-specific protease, partial [Bacteroidota bacterium]